MNSGLPDHERDLNHRLDRAIPPHAQATGASDDDPLVRAAQRLAKGPDVTFTDAAFDRIEARLHRQMDVSMPRPSSSPSVSPHHRSRRFRPGMVLRLAAAMLVIALGLVTLNQASATSLPGDRLYPLKRAVEDLRVALVTKDSEADFRLSLAIRRVDEFEALLARDRIYPEVLAEANGEIKRALDLLANGHGNWVEVDSQLRAWDVRTTSLLEQAKPHADVSDRVYLETVAGDAAQLQKRIEILAPPLPPDPMTPTATPVVPALPPPTVAATPTHPGAGGAGGTNNGEGGSPSGGTPPGQGGTGSGQGGNSGGGDSHGQGGNSSGR